MTGKNSVTVRDILKEDLPQLARLEADLFSDCWSRESLLDSLGQSYVRFYGAYKENKLVGYLIFSHIVDELEIFRIGVKPSCQRGGIAKLLIEALISFGKEEKAARVLLDVRQSNRPARALYKKMGFLEDGRRRDFYEDPREDALLMSMDLT